MIATRTIAHLAALSFFLTACLEEADGEQGEMWSLRAIPAEGHRLDNGQSVDILATNGDYSSAYGCYCPELSDIISDGIAGNLTPGSSEETWYDNELELFRAGAANQCSIRAGEIGFSLGTVILFDGATDVSCLDAASDELPYRITIKCVDLCDDEIPLPGTGGTPPPDTSSTSADTTAGDDTTAGNSDGGLHVYDIDSWSDVIDITGTNTYTLDEDFAEFLIEDLTIFVDDNIGVGIGESALSNEGFELETVGEASIADALEFQTGDIVWELNGDRLESIEDVTKAFETLQLETVFKVKLDRGSTTITKTITLDDLSTYP